MAAVGVWDRDDAERIQPKLRAAACCVLRRRDEFLHTQRKRFHEIFNDDHPVVRDDALRMELNAL